MDRNHESSDHKPNLEILGEILTASFLGTREGQIAEAKAQGFTMVGISAAGVIGETGEPLRNIDSVSDPKLVRPFKKWLKRNGYENHISRIE